MPSTARELHDALYWLGVWCRDCQHGGGDADLPALVASGRGDVPVDRLPWRCTACGSRRVEFRIGLSAEGHRRNNAAHYATMERLREQWAREGR